MIDIYNAIKIFYGKIFDHSAPSFQFLKSGKRGRMWLRKSLCWRTVRLNSIKITRVKTHIFVWKSELIWVLLHLSNGILRAGVVRETRLASIDYTVSSIFYHHLCRLLMYSAKLSTECTRDDCIITFFLNRFLIHQTVCGKRLRVRICLLFLLFFFFESFLITFTSFCLERILLRHLLILCRVNYTPLLLSRLFEVVASFLTFQALGTLITHFLFFRYIYYKMKDQNGFCKYLIDVFFFF